MINFKEPIDLIADNEEPNECPFDSFRTDLLEVRDDHTIETCPKCKRLFNFWNDSED